MLKIKDNVVKSGYQNRWYYENYKYLDDFNIEIKDEFPEKITMCLSFCI